MKNIIKPNERLDDLQIPMPNGKSLSVIQNPKGFCFGVDAVLLANFAQIRKNFKVVDFGTGSGVIPLLIAAKTNASHITGIEIQKEVAAMARRSVVWNELEDKIDIANEDLKTFGSDLSSTFDAVLCNPPYKESGGGIINPNDTMAIARHEIHCTLFDVISSASRLLRVGGKLNLIHRPERLVDIICIMREHKLEAKRIRFIHPKPHKTATMVIVEATKGGKPKLFLEPPLYVYNENGEYSDEINKIYGREI